MSELRHVTAAKVQLTETRPAFVELELDSPQAPFARYVFDPVTAFEIAHQMAMLAFRLEPTLVDELRERTRELERPL